MEWFPETRAAWHRAKIDIKAALARRRDAIDAERAQWLILKAIKTHPGEALATMRLIVAKVSEPR